VLLRDLGPLPQTDLRHTVWRKGLRAVTLGGLRPLRPADIDTPGSMITVIPEGYAGDQEALTKAGVILIKFAPGELHVPTNYNGGTLVSTMNWTVDSSILLQDLHPCRLPGRAVRADHAPHPVPVPPVDLRRGQRRQRDLRPGGPRAAAAAAHG
jgi:hypothetical protein